MDKESFIDALNGDLRTEYQSIVQYISHVATVTGADFLGVIDELKMHLSQELNHAEVLAEQIAFLDGTPSTVVPKVEETGKFSGAGLRPAPRGKPARSLPTAVQPSYGLGATRRGRSPAPATRADARACAGPADGARQIAAINGARLRVGFGAASGSPHSCRSSNHTTLPPWAFCTPHFDDRTLTSHSSRPSLGVGPRRLRDPWEHRTAVGYLYSDEVRADAEVHMDLRAGMKHSVCHNLRDE